MGGFELPPVFRPCRTFGTLRPARNDTAHEVGQALVAIPAMSEPAGEWAAPAQSAAIVLRIS